MKTKTNKRCEQLFIEQTITFKLLYFNCSTVSRTTNSVNPMNCDEYVDLAALSVNKLTIFKSCLLSTCYVHLYIPIINHR